MQQRYREINSVSFYVMVTLGNQWLTNLPKDYYEFEMTAPKLGPDLWPLANQVCWVKMEIRVQLVCY